MSNRKIKCSQIAANASYLSSASSACINTRTELHIQSRTARVDPWLDNLQGGCIFIIHKLRSTHCKLIASLKIERLLLVEFNGYFFWIWVSVNVTLLVKHFYGSRCATIMSIEISFMRRGAYTLLQFRESNVIWCNCPRLKLLILILSHWIQSCWKIKIKL